jgi:hypothetical protein
MSEYSHITRFCLRSSNTNLYMMVLEIGTVVSALRFNHKSRLHNEMSKPGLKDHNTES